MNRLLLSLFCLLALAAPAQAGISTWTPAIGLTEPWTREFEPHLGSVYAGTEFDGVFKSDNAGISWSAVSGGLSASNGSMSIRSLDSIGGTLFAGTTAGLFKLSGSTWQPVGQAPDTAVGKRLDKAVQTVLSSGGVMLAGVASGGVYRSTDGGATWIKPPYGNGMGVAETVWGLTAHPTVPNRVLAATGSGMFASNDSGATWTPKTDGIPWGATTLRVVVHPAAPNVYFASTLEGVYRSVTAGETWAPINTGLTANSDDIRGVFLQAANRMYAATQSGVYASDVINIQDPFQVRWRLIANNGLDNSIFWALGDAFFGANTLLGGTQDGAAHITLAPPDNTSAPTITAEDNLFRVGKKLTAHPGSWNGTPTLAYTYQWYFCPSGANCSPIADATDNDFVLRPGDQSDKLRVRVTAQNAYPGPPVNADSAMTPFITANPDALPSSPAPTLSLIESAGTPQDGFPEPGDTIHSTAGNWTNGGSVDTYQWLRCDFDTPDDCAPARAPTISSNYLLTESDVGFRIRVILTGSNDAGSGMSTISGSTNLIFPPAPVNLELPVVVGQPYVGESLFGSVGTWESPSTQFTRRWMRCDGAGESCEYAQKVNSSDPEVGATYTVRASDLGSTLKVEVKGDPNGANQKPDPVVVQSAPSAVIVAAPPEPVDPGGGGGGGETPPGGGGGTPPGGGTVPDTVAPVVKTFTATKSVRRGGKVWLVIVLSERSTATITVERAMKGRKKGKKCVKPTRKLRKAKKCTRYKRVGKPIVQTLRAETSNLSIPTTRRTRPGRYRVTIVVRDAAGNVSAKRRATYKVTRR